MTPKDHNRNTVRSFNPSEWGKGFTEGNSWHHSFPAYGIHNPGNNKLVEVFGSDAELLKKLKQMLVVSGKFMVGSYGQVNCECKERLYALICLFLTGNS